MIKNSVIDTHLHIWDPLKLKYDWLKSVPVLDRPFLMEDFIEATEEILIEKLVFIECNCDDNLNEEEVKWIEEIAKKYNKIQAIVAYANLTNEKEIDSNLERLMTHDMVRGIRHNIQFNEKGFATQPLFIQGIKKVFKSGMHFELCMTHDQMDECFELVSALPDGPLMLDHCGKPGIKSGEIAQWKKNIKRLSEFENVFCKVSGLLTEADINSWATGDILPYTDYVLECFGTDRIIYGSDWPVSVLAGGYKAWYNFTQVWTESWSESEVCKYYRDNASDFYRI